MRVASFAAAVTALLGRPLGSDDLLAIAVSGGPDSLALLLLAHAAFENRIRALTVDHRLRPDSVAEATAVARLCAARGIPHALLDWTGDKPAANLQAAARAARYRLMAGWCAAHGVAWLATAHHADDQAETLLMRLARGTGSGGLAGIRSARRLGGGVTLLRPLLGWRKAELAAIVAAAGLNPADDPTNADPRFDRTRARALLARAPWLAAPRLAAAAAHLADAEAALDWTAEFAWAGRAETKIVIPAKPGTHFRKPQEMGSRFRGNDPEEVVHVVLDTAGLPVELVRRLVVRALGEFGAAPRGPAVARLIARLAAGRAATLGGVSAHPGPIWTFRRAPLRRSAAES